MMIKLRSVIKIFLTPKTYFTLAHGEPEIIHVNVLDVKQLQTRQVVAGGGEEVHNCLVYRPGFVIQTEKRQMWENPQTF